MIGKNNTFSVYKNKLPFKLHINIDNAFEGVEIIKKQMNCSRRRKENKSILFTAFMNRKVVYHRDTNLLLMSQC